MFSILFLSFNYPPASWCG